MLPVPPGARPEVGQPPLRRHPDVSVETFRQTVDPVVGQTALGVLDGVGLPGAAIVEASACDPVRSGPSGDPDIPIVHLQHVIDKGVGQTMLDIVVGPVFGFRVEQGEAAAVGSDHESVSILAEVKNAIRQQA